MSERDPRVSSHLGKALGGRHPGEAQRYGAGALRRNATFCGGPGKKKGMEKWKEPENVEKSWL